jgi:CrcB-like protein, Camphor Resistance (CrcB)
LKQFGFPQLSIRRVETMPPTPQIFVKSDDGGTVPHAATYDCTSAEEGDERLVSHIHYEDDHDVGPESKSGPLERTEPAPIPQTWHNIAAPLFYISTFAILGTVLRLYVGRLFGLDCLQKERGDVESDFLSPLFSLVCITSDGRTERGGALFIDLPANMLGSFFMGLMSPPEKDQASPLVWLRRDHPLQKDTSLHLGLKVGFCGCLTTCKFNET